MSDKNDPIEALTQSILAILDLDPHSLPEQDIPDGEPECMLDIDEFDGEFAETWENIRFIMSELMGDYEYATTFLDVSDPSERLIIFSEMTDELSKDCAHLKIEYYLSGKIKVTSKVILNTSNKSPRRQDNPRADSDKVFICDELASITPDQVQATQRQMLSMKCSSDE